MARTRSPNPASTPQTTTYRGIRWRRTAGEGLAWWDEEDGEWIRWRRGADAPPRPPDWETGQSIYENRPKWRSPYRLVPIVLAVLVIALGAEQAFHGGGHDAAKRAAKQEATTAKRLVGRCLARDGTTDGQARYTSNAVACDGPKAAVKVVRAVAPLARGAGAGSKCPAGTTSMALVSPGATEAYQLCIRPVTKQRR